MLRPRLWLSPDLWHLSVQNRGVQSPDVSRPMAWPTTPLGSSLLFGERGSHISMCEEGRQGPSYAGCWCVAAATPWALPGTCITTGLQAQYSSSPCLSTTPAKLSAAVLCVLHLVHSCLLFSQDFRSPPCLHLQRALCRLLPCHGCVLFCLAPTLGRPSKTLVCVLQSTPQAPVQAAACPLVPQHTTVAKHRWAPA